MELPSYFIDFLKDIRLTENQTNDLITGHKTLRSRLNSDETLSKIIVSDFLQGSYRRATAVRPKDGNRSDVDVVVVTKLSMDDYTPEQALQVFVPFCEKWYKDKYRIQGRSIGISLSYVDLDIVVTAAPSESEEGILKSESVRTDYNLEQVMDWKLVESWLSPENRTTYRADGLMKMAEKEQEWKSSPLYIPNREADAWEPTDPLAQIVWTRKKNQDCNGHYVNVVKALKWWRRVFYPDAGQPKSYPLEHFIGQCCPDGITSVAKGVTLTLEKIVNDHTSKPILPDHGVPEHDVFQRVTEEEYEQFYDEVCAAAKTAREALDATTVAESAELWQKLFGKKFPDPPESKTNVQKNSVGGFTERTAPSVIGGGRFG